MAWIDLETAGLSSTDPILEVGIIVTDKFGNVVEVFHRVVGYLDDWRGAMKPGARDMHSHNGLMADVDLASDHLRKHFDESGHSKIEVERDAVAFLDDLFDYHGPEVERAHKIPMAGASVQFDRAVLKEQMPELHDWFHYRQYDVSTLLALARMMGVNPEDEIYQSRLHRSIPDLHDEIAVHRWVMKTFRYGQDPESLPF